uniref:Apple domain-containing protein n=1 Tax=Populus alba TaxID=43335 RepID=A0A4U5R319_POPAL|nr:hypothetical protein D5086_0000023040 [Populus alba]
MSPLCSQNFLELKSMKAGKPDAEPGYSDENDCMNKCLSKCNCQAYSYHKAEKGDNNFTCWTWFKDLNNIQEQYDRGRDLKVRVPLSAIASVKRKCEICGTTIIPYPLSTGPNCGDKMYFRFHCDDSISQLMFEAPDGAYYRVTGIDEELQKFSIDVGNADCTAIESMGNYMQQHNQSWPFHVIGRCDANRSNIILGSSFEGTRFAEVEIGWAKPSEPLCNSLDECNDWQHSTCSSATNGMKRCLCSKSFWWDPKTVSCIPASTKKGRSLYLVLLGVIAASVIILCASFFLYYLRRSTKFTGRGTQYANS